jgi:ribosomal protein L7/L12
MEFLGIDSRWIIAAGAWTAGFLLGRLTTGGGDREARRLAEAEAARSAFAALSPDRQGEVDRLIRDKQTIAAIKLVRETTGLGLKESKAAVDARRRETL